MKYKLFVALLLFTVNLSAQNFKGALYGSFIASHVRGDGMGGFNKPGVEAGVKVAYPFKEQLDISFGLAFVQKGSRRIYDQYGSPRGGAWHVLRANYFEVPIKSSYKIGDIAELEFGLTGAYLIGSFLTYDRGGGNYGTDFLGKAEWGALIGATYIYKDDLVFYIRNTGSIISIDKTNFHTILTPWNINQGYTPLYHRTLRFGVEKRF